MQKVDNTFFRIGCGMPLLFSNPPTMPKTLIALYNTVGKLVIEKYYNNAFFTISIEHLPKGVYLYKVFISASEQYMGKFVKQ